MKTTVKLTGFILSKAIIPALKSSSKQGAIRELVHAIASSYGDGFPVSDAISAIMQRERIGSTGIGNGVGIPHARLQSINNIVGAFGRISKGIDYNAIDGEPVNLIFLILAPPSMEDEFIYARRLILKAAKHPNFMRFLRAAKTINDIEEIFHEIEESISI